MNKIFAEQTFSLVLFLFLAKPSAQAFYTKALYHICLSLEAKDHIVF